MNFAIPFEISRWSLSEMAFVTISLQPAVLWALYAPRDAPDARWGNVCNL